MTAVTTTSPARADRTDVLTLLGLVAHLELAAFTRLAADSAVAPTMDQRLRLMRFSAGAVDRLDRIFAHIEDLGGSPELELSRFTHNMNVLTTRVGKAEDELTNLVASSSEYLGEIAAEDPEFKRAEGRRG